ncbi:MAG: phenylalanine--tRNA ligase subunit beta, partial [Candidatus Aenigmarchaeota archaeon]|nr:phenylalanine--tRNA ligase subunit beta [Candidatus Aenigmarchaeota archaeon]
GLKKYPVFLDGNNTIMSMPPIINSHDVGKITEKTKAVFVEATGTDLNTLKIAINIILATLADMGGTIYSLEMDYGMQKFEYPDFTPRKIKINRKYTEKLLGITLSETEIKKLLAKMGLGYENGYTLIPAYRADILHPIDIIEDIAIAYGYENFEEVIPAVATIAGETKKTIFERKAAEVMTGFGALECKSYHITDEMNLCEKMNTEKRKLIKPKNPSNVEYDTLRDNLVSGLMKILSENTHYEYPQNLFEIGDVMLFDKNSETSTKENMHLAFASASIDSDFSKIKATLESALCALDIKAKIKKANHPSFIESRSAEIKLGGKTIGYLGEIHPKVLNKWNLEVPVSVFEIDLSSFVN